VTTTEASRAAKQGLADVDVRRTWLLLGDPLLRLGKAGEGKR
jgi:hypothetical protein